MSLYDDITVDAGGPQAEGWSKNFKMLQTQLQVKKVTLTQAKQSQRVRQGSTLAPVVDLKKQVVSEERPLFADPILSLIVGHKDAAILGEALCFVADEYDPLYPNDYEKVVKRQREERQRQREIERQKDMDDREKKRKERPEGGGLVQGPDSDDDEEDDEYEAEKRKRVLGGATIAPPSSLMDRDKSALLVEEDSMRHSRMGGKAAIPPPMFDEGSERSRSPPILPGTFLSNMGGTVAHKIMAKYGFREGQGLGKHEQGLSTALSVEKTSKRGGKIVIGEMQEKETSTSTPMASVAKKGTDQSLNPLTKMLKNPTKVVLLRNMVGAGEVDEDLEGETKEECEKYGKVIRCLIFELPTSNDEEAVRIFLEFERIESAIKAVVDLNGRYFGGRVVKASFYNLDKFRRLDLGENISP